jgi:ankyrin repeat protein
MNTMTKNGWTAIMWAAWEGHSNVVKRLVAMRSNANGPDLTVRRALVLGKRHQEIVKLLKEYIDETKEK